MEVSARLRLVPLHVHDPLEQPDDLAADADAGPAAAGPGLGRGLLPQLDLGQHADEQLVHVVVDAGRRLDVLAAEADREGLAGWNETEAEKSSGRRKKPQKLQLSKQREREGKEN